MGRSRLSLEGCNSASLSLVIFQEKGWKGIQILNFIVHFGIFGQSQSAI